MTVNELAVLTHQLREYAFKHFDDEEGLYIHLERGDFFDLHRAVYYGPYADVGQNPHYFRFEGVVISWAPTISKGRYVWGRDGFILK